MAVLDYSNSGHVSDTDAASLNYDDLLKTLREGVKENNKERKKAGIPTVELVGWAAPPRYESGSKKLYWAKELAFEGETEHTLNYMIRVLGREGTIDVNIVGSMKDLPLVEKAAPDLLSQIDFLPGHAYADYREGSDHLAEFGVAGLVLGGIAAKAGLFKVLLGVLAASWKAVAIGLAGLGAFLAKRFGGKKDGGPAA